jgi:hypothetical protein
VTIRITIEWHLTHSLKKTCQNINMSELGAWFTPEIPETPEVQIRRIML